MPPISVLVGTFSVEFHWRSGRSSKSVELSISTVLMPPWFTHCKMLPKFWPTIPPT